AGFGGGGGGLPHADTIQRAFGRHDISGVKAHVGGAASAAAAQLGAEAYASGDRIAFSSSPDLFLAAHEAAHVVQQRAGVSLPGGMGQVGDRYERHADEVAAMVVSGGNAESVLDKMVGGGQDAAVQCRSLPLSGADAGGRNAEPNHAEKNAEHHERQRLEAEVAEKGRDKALGALGQVGTRQFELVSVAISGTFPKAVGPADLTLKGLCKYEAAAVKEGEGESETELEAEIEVNLEMGLGSVLKLYVGGTGRLRVTLPGAVLAGEFGASAMSQVVARAASHAVKAVLQRDAGAILKRLSSLHAQAEAGLAAATEAYRAALVKAMTVANEEEGFGFFEADPVIARYVGVATRFTKGMLDLGAAKATRDAGGLPSGYTDLLRHLCSVQGVVAGLGIPPAGRLDKAALGLHMNEVWRAGSAFDKLRETLKERAQGLSLPSMSVAEPPKFIGDLGLQVGFSAELGEGRPSAEGKAQALMRVKSADASKSADPAKGSSVDLEVGVRLLASVSVPMGKRTATFAAEYSRFGAPRGEEKAKQEIKVAGSIAVDASRPAAEVAQQVGESARAAIGGSGAALFEGKADAGSLSAICRAFARNLISTGEHSTSTTLEVEFSYDFEEDLVVKTLAKESHGVKTKLASASLEAGTGFEAKFRLPKKTEA
ncbi:MAG TPA: DUF4157 domain-containing protein, partial [Myxococcota bacterium]|nr:DUF4157 domain-containing protein [Myxococcota bacterium]